MLVLCLALSPVVGVRLQPPSSANCSRREWFEQFRAAVKPTASDRRLVMIGCCEGAGVVAVRAVGRKPRASGDAPAGPISAAMDGLAIRSNRAISRSTRRGLQRGKRPGWRSG